MEIFEVIQPDLPGVPVIISSPHSGTSFPPEIADQIQPEFITNPDDSDWFIDRLYDFAPSLGVTMIRANLNRWVIDLNRDPDSRPLYSDGRIITGLVPLTTFNGRKLYSIEPTDQEIKRRRLAYYQPYHEELARLIGRMKDKFGQVLLFDAHSIRRVVSGIRKAPFPDLILGDADETSAAVRFIQTAERILKSGPYEFSHNHPFKGGYITRHYGDPKNNIHALQLEMAKINYMDDSETAYDQKRAGKMRSHLKKLFAELINQL